MRRAAGYLILLLLGGLVPPALAEEDPLAAFYGDYVGRTISEKERGKKERDQSIRIRPGKGKKRGFSLQWKTVIPRADGSTSEKSQKINFQKTKRSHIYEAGMKPDLFGGWEPLDPMKGQPYIWAMVKDKQMLVYFMHVLDDGTYEMQVYDRQLTADGMHVNFSRSRNGEQIRSITGVLTRKK